MKADIDKAIGQVLISVDEAKRRELYKYILGTLHDQAVYMPLTYQTNIMVYRDKPQGRALRRGPRTRFPLRPCIKK